MSPRAQYSIYLTTNISSEFAKKSNEQSHKSTNLASVSIGLHSVHEQGLIDSVSLRCHDIVTVR